MSADGGTEDRDRAHRGALNLADARLVRRYPSSPTPPLVVDGPALPAYIEILSARPQGSRRGLEA